MLPDLRAVGIEQWPGLRQPASTGPQRVAVVATRDEADLLALGLVGRDEVQRACDRAHLGLRQLAEREARVLQLVGPEAVQEVGLVLVVVPGPVQPRSPIGPDDTAGVVTGRHRLAVVQVPRPPEQRAELHVGVAVDAGARRLAAQVRVEEGLDDAGVELALEVHDVERDIELRCDPSGVVGRIERTAALLEL